MYLVKEIDNRDHSNTDGVAGQDFVQQALGVTTLRRLGLSGMVDQSEINSDMASLGKCDRGPIFLYFKYSNLC